MNLLLHIIKLYFINQVYFLITFSIENRLQGCKSLHFSLKSNKTKQKLRLLIFCFDL